MAVKINAQDPKIFSPTPSLSPATKYPAIVEAHLQERNFPEAEKKFRLFLMGLGKQNTEQLSIPEMQKIVQLGQEVLRHVDHASFDILVPLLLESMTHFPMLYQEQIDLALLLANKTLTQAEKEPLDKRLPLYTQAMHYYGKALSITDKWDKPQTRKLSIEASKIFMHVISDQIVTSGAFQKRLALARGSGDLSRFQTVLDEITFLKKFRCDSPDHQIILTLYSQAEEVLLELQQRGKETQQFAPYAQRIFQEQHEPYSPQTTPPAIERYQSALKNFRTSFEQKRKNLTLENIRLFQTQLHQEFLSFFQTFLQDAFAILGPPPCAYDLRACGSLAREEFCPYSDIEWMILIEDIKYTSYFKTLAEIINLQIVSLGETAATNLPVFSALGEKNRSGFHVDTGGNPATDNLIGTPQTLALLQKPLAGQNISDAVPTLAFHSLRKTTSLQPTNDPTLFKLYSAALNFLLDEQDLRKKRAIGHLRFRLNDYQARFDPQWRQKPLLNIKENFVELLNHPLSDLALYFSCKEQNTLDLIDALPCFSPDNRVLLKEAVSAIYLLRTRLHLQYGEQKETAAQTPQTIEKSLPLLEEEKFLLEKIYCLILRPFYAHLANIFNGEDPTIEEIDLLTLAFEGACQEEPFSKETLFHLGRHFLKIGKNADHLPLYQKLSERNLELLREAYLEGISEQKPLVRLLEFVPNQYGKRLIEDRERLALEGILATLTTHDEKEEWQGLSVEITSPHLRKLRTSSYLQREVLQHILTPDGNIKRGYDKETQSHVVQFCVPPYDLHFKQQPSDLKKQSPFHPGKEQAVSRLIMRLFGHGTSFSTLTSFTVYQHGKEDQRLPRPHLKNRPRPDPPQDPRFK